jgi:hypothetical protein
MDLLNGLAPLIRGQLGSMVGMGSFMEDIASITDGVRHRSVGYEVVARLADTDPIAIVKERREGELCFRAIRL